MKRRRDVSVFGLSFLDVMFCGFGSVILLVMIINSDTLAKRKEVHQDLRGEVVRLETEVRTGQDYLVEIRNTLEQTCPNRFTPRGTRPSGRRWKRCWSERAGTCPARQSA